MFVDVTIGTGGEGTVALIPRTAVQTVGSRTVVYLADANQPGRFVEREVRLGNRAGTMSLSGVKPGDTIVAVGSFVVRAERDRLGFRSGDRLHRSPLTGQPTLARLIARLASCAE